jgi:hypothetical protein
VNDRPIDSDSESLQGSASKQTHGQRKPLGVCIVHELFVPVISRVGVDQHLASRRGVVIGAPAPQLLPASVAARLGSQARRESTGHILQIDIYHLSIFRVTHSGLLLQSLEKNLIPSVMGY